MKQNNSSARRHMRGLTLIELLVTIAVLAVLMGLAAPSMARFIGQWRVSNAVNALTGSLRLARTEAIARGRVVVICSVPSNSSTSCKSNTGTDAYASGWIVFANNDGNSGLTFSESNGDELLLRQEALTGIADITLKNGGKFVFYPNGLTNLSSANGVNVDASGYVSASKTPWARKAFCISKAGRIRYVADNSDCN
ncbi:GspH/FimT family pseudopilin [Comamonas sp. w2-DMI]|uniref:GspH/FimT family pseudopilin n=1 Tax=Comamonas sp. w2-DMI TaxID=3126391 RepID=UPI0032E36FCC